MFKYSLRDFFDKINFFKSISLKVSLSFYIVVIISLFFDIFDIFLYAFIFVLFHEATHIFVARIFGIKCKKIFITPLGQIAILDKIERLSRNKKLMVVSSGVILNLILALIFSVDTNEKMQLIRNINLSVAFFNILPIYPLDGGRFLQYYLGSKIGDLKASYVVKKISSIVSFSLFCLGFLQIIFFPYNISLFCLGFYLKKINKNEYIRFTFEFYKNLTEKVNFQADRVINVKQILVNKNTINKDILINLSQDYNMLINIQENGNIIANIWENDFLQYIEKNGLNDRIYDIYLYNLK